MITEQLTLDASPEVAPPPRPPLEDRWTAFKTEHPWALGEIARVTRELTSDGRAPTIARVWEELRTRVWTSGDPYRWDNSFRAFAARDVMASYPDLDGTFRTRRSRADRGRATR